MVFSERCGKALDNECWEDNLSLDNLSLDSLSFEVANAAELTESKPLYGLTIFCLNDV